MIPRDFSTPVACAAALGLAAGAACHMMAPHLPAAHALAELLAGGAELFLQLVRWLAAPMLLASVVAGLGAMGAPAAAWRVGWRAAACFAAGAALALAAGAAAFALLPASSIPNLSQDLAPGAAAAPAGMAWLRATPDSLPSALLHGEALPVAIFAVAFGIALASARNALSGTLLAAAEDAVIGMLPLVRIAGRLSPFAAFAAAAAVSARHGPQAVLAWGGLVAGTLAALALTGGLLALAAFAALGRDAPRFLRGLRDPAALGFATASSEAAYPRLMEHLDDWGVPHRASGMVLPLGMAFHQCGTTAFLAFAVPFLAQAYGAQAGLQGCGTLLLVAVGSRAVAGVPRAAVAAVAAFGPAAGLPPEAALLLLGIDPLLDMGRTAVNVAGNGLAAAAAVRWSGLPSRRSPWRAGSAGSLGRAP